MFLILGLGNPGPRYELTRHNAGFWVVDNLAEKYNIRLDRHKYFSLYGKGEVEGLEVVLAKPMTYMNESGKAAKSLLSAFNLSPERMLVIHDEIDFPLGRIKKKVQRGRWWATGNSINDSIHTDRGICAGSRGNRPARR